MVCESLTMKSQSDLPWTPVPLLTEPWDWTVACPPGKVCRAACGEGVATQQALTLSTNRLGLLLGQRCRLYLIETALHCLVVRAPGQRPLVEGKHCPACLLLLLLGEHDGATARSSGAVGLKLLHVDAGLLNTLRTTQQTHTFS